MTSHTYTDSTAPAAGRTATRTGPHIVVGVDGGIGGWLALAWARDEAIATEGRLTLCQAGSPPAGGSSMDALTLADPPLARAVHDVRQRIGGQWVDLRIAPGDPAGLLDETAADADLVVVGPPLHRGVRSTALRTAGTCRRPVVVVRPVRGAQGIPFAGHVIAALGGGPCDPLVADFAMRYAAVHHLPVAAVHVSTHAPGDFWLDEDTLETHFAAEPPQIGMLARVLEPLRVRHPDVAVRLCVLVGSPGARLVLASAAARLIVVGRRHHRLPVSAPGGTSGALVRNGTVPVAVIPPESRDGHRRP
jgi:nucleotide-binding universal stress UspA family protein